MREKIAARYKLNMDGSKIVESSKIAEIAYFFKKITNSATVKIAGVAAGYAISVDPINVLGIVLDKITGDGEKTGDVIDRGLESALFELKGFIRSLGEFPNVLIVFDQLDEEYTEKGTANADTYSDILRSLFSASVDIADMNLGIQPLVLLREDIYDSFQSANKGKFQDFMVTLNWTIEGMKEVISQRLNRTLGKPKEFRFENMWLSLFTPFFNESVSLPDGRIIDRINISSYDAFMRHTSRTPRDCIMLLLCVAKQMVASKKQLCDINIFKAARISMAEYFYQQVVDATSTAHPYITDVFRVLSENMTESKVAKQKLEEWLIKSLPNVHCETDLLLNSLYDVCAIGLVNDYAKKYRTKYIGYPKYTLKAGDQIVLHPSIAIALGINLSIQGNSLINEYKEEDVDDMELIEAARLQLMIEQDRFSLKRINIPEQEVICAEQLNGKLWSMLCCEIEDGYAMLHHKRFDQRIKLNYKEHGITTPLAINDVCIVEIEIGVNANNKEKKYFLVKSYAKAE